MKHQIKQTLKILKLGVTGILFFSSLTFIEAKNPEPNKARTSNISVMKAPQNLSSNFFQSFKTMISILQPTKTLTSTSSKTVGSFTVEGDTTGYTNDMNEGKSTLSFSKNGEYKISGNGKEVSNQTIAVSPNFEGTIILENVNITSTDVSPFFVDKTAKLTIDLKGTNKLSTNSINDAVIDFSDATGDAHLTITSSSNDGNLECNTLNISTAATIGGKNNSAGNNITIAGGDVAVGCNSVYEKSGAGIGSGYKGNANNIEIAGGTVTTTSITGAGIGGSSHSNKADNISITGGTITATSDSGAGIGGGTYGMADHIKISGGTVTAISKSGAGIGSGNSSAIDDIEISGGKVTAKSELGAGIGSGNFATANNINISGGTVTGTSAAGAGIGSGYYAAVNNINLTGGTVTAISIAGAGIGSGEGSSNSPENIIISNGSVKASSIGDVLPTDGKGNNVYLAKLENQSGINEVTVDGNHITRQVDHESDNAFYLYLSGKNHTVTSNGVQLGARWNDKDGFRWISESTYQLTIPASVNLNKENTVETSIDQVELIDATKTVNVKVSNNTDISSGNLTLKRLNDSDNKIISSLVSFDKEGENLVHKGSILFSVGDMGNDKKTLYFQKPVSPNDDLIFAGNYIGIINFEVSID